MVTAVIWLKFCRYGVKLLINQSINWVAAIKDALLRVFSYSGVPVEPTGFLSATLRNPVGSDDGRKIEKVPD